DCGSCAGDRPRPPARDRIVETNRILERDERDPQCRDLAADHRDALRPGQEPGLLANDGVATGEHRMRFVAGQSNHALPSSCTRTARWSQVTSMLPTRAPTSFW